MTRNNVFKVVSLAAVVLALGFVLSGAVAGNSDARSLPTLPTLQKPQQQIAPVPFAPCSCQPRFTGHDPNGNFQNALEQARQLADAHYASMGADILYCYRVIGTNGRRGGFAGFNDICVEIETCP